ncbi:class I adenylate-forming enzyme family protein [Caldimonas brevitalea]|uniref:Long-chain acyl-CoA synthetase n=1 Tax=Caldimonas brevitalea TaxID=413882 RepID=A0A0G3BG09_9BURK|nr:class I adenylate-forming enzyme family protein [Caldimonas brevitalea]AKJ26893.1 long-chain acyl-CoA synthetase [Caldimonas brevitalea]
MTALLLVPVAVVLAYLVFAVVRLGLPRRLALLAFWNGRVEHTLEEAERRHGQRTLFQLAQPLAWVGDLTWSARRTREVVERLSASWHHLGVRKGDRVAVYKRNDFDHFLFSLAAVRIGAIAVPMNVNVAGETAARFMERMGVRLLITDTQGYLRVHADGVSPPHTVRWVVLSDARALDGNPAGPLRVHRLADLLKRDLPAMPVCPRGAGDPLYIVHTSGTTDLPKGVIVTSEGMAQSLRSFVLFNPVSRADLACLALPLNHQVSHLYLHGILLMGLRCIVNSELAAPRLIRQIEEQRPTLFFAFPITYTRLIAAGALERGLDSVRIWGTTADASHEVQQRAFVTRGSFFRRLGIPVAGALFLDGLGSSEVGIAALLRITTPWTRRFGRRIGRRAPLGPRIRVADVEGRPVPRGEVGRLMIKGKSLFGGYWNAHDALYATTRDGWWFTGDLVLEGDDGELVHLDHEVDVMHTATGPVYTLPIEEVVLKHPGVLDTCVFGVRQDPEGPELPAAVVALRTDAAPVAASVLRRTLNATLGADQQLRHVWVIDWEEFPIGATGKTLKRKLRERYNAQLQGWVATLADTPCEPLLSQVGGSLQPA